MSMAQKLRVIGTRKILRFFLPPDGTPFASSEFILVSSTQAIEAFETLSDDVSVTLVIDPEDYPLEALMRLRGVVWWWFLKRVVLGDQESSLGAERLLAFAGKQVDIRLRVLEELSSRSSSFVVVSDPTSHDLCRDLGVVAALSPPPVNDSLSLTKSSVTMARFAYWSEPSSYSEQFTKFRPEDFAGGISLVPGPDSNLEEISHSVIIRSSVIREFPYEVAVCLSAGQTVLTESLYPQWGLEPGIDFFEVSTPQELHYSLDAFRRSPRSSLLMRSRGRLKAANFVSSKVLSNVFFIAYGEKGFS